MQSKRSSPRPPALSRSSSSPIIPNPAPVNGLSNKRSSFSNQSITGNSFLDDSTSSLPSLDTNSQNQSRSQNSSAGVATSPTKIKSVKLGLSHSGSTIINKNNHHKSSASNMPLQQLAMNQSLLSQLAESSCDCGNSNCSCTMINKHYGSIEEGDAESIYTSTSGNAQIRGLVPHKKSPKNLSYMQKLPYYLPITSWLPSYSVEYFFHDLVAGLSLASYQIPLSLSFATAVAHVPAICGLLGLAFGPIVYMILGSVPQMIVGPEAAVSMIVGQAIEKIVKHNPDVNPVDLLVVMTSCSGAILLAFGLLRFGFIDDVLCGSLLKGFITAIGLTMMIGSSMTILGLDTIFKNLPADQHVHSPFAKVVFICEHLHEYKKITTIIGGTTFFILIMTKQVKKQFVQHRFKKASFFPEILVVVVIATILSYYFDFESHDIEIVGKIQTDGFRFKSPLSKDLRPWYGELFGIAFMCAILGFFESSTAGKSLSPNLDLPVSSNRELVALGTIGLTVGCFGTLSSFGGYARSKLNAVNGAKTPAAGMFMGLTTLFVTYFLTEYLYYMPMCVLNAVIATVAISLIQETPKEVKFHIRTKGYNELITFCVTLFTSLFFSIELGVALGCFYSVMRVIKHSTSSRIQILCRVSGKDTFINSEALDELFPNTTAKPKEFVVAGYKEYRRESLMEAERPMQSTNSKNIVNEYAVLPELEDRDGCVIVKIPEPLTFTNANDMKGRLKRIELYGSASGHPAGLQRDLSSIRHIVFDLHGMTSIDSSAAQILYDIIENYQKRDIGVFFCRVFTKARLLKRFKDSGIKELLSVCQGEELGIKQTIPPYYDEILDALKAIDLIESNNNFDVRSYFSAFVYNGLS